MISLRRFLLTSLSAGLVLVTGLAAALGYFESRHEAEELFDAQMAQYARLLLINLTDTHDGNVLTIRTPGDIDLLPGEDEIGRRGHRYENKLLFQFWDQDRLVARSRNAPDAPLFANKPGYHTVRFVHYNWRVFVLQGNHAHWLVVAEREDIRNELALQLAVEAILPIILGLPLLLALVWWVAGYATRQLQDIALELQQRNADDLHPIRNENSPLELRSVLDALNNLFMRLRTVMDLEKRFTADAAHELRTPIAGMKLHIQNALADTRADSPVYASLKKADAATDRMNHIVQQLLALNRGLIQGPSTTLVPVNISALIESIVREHQTYAQQHQQQLSVQISPASVNGHADMLQMLLRNLVDNALRYTPDGGRVEIRIENAECGISLTVSDSGPGIPVSERERVLERFYRLDGDSHDSGTEGCGLGLSIVKRVADYHGATLLLDEDPQLHGLRVRVTFKA